MKGYSLNQQGVTEVPFEQDEDGTWRNTETINDVEVIYFEGEGPSLRPGQSIVFTHTFTIRD